jgi:hypothetical protein
MSAKQVDLNVRGQIITTFDTTLKTESDSKLAKLVSSHEEFDNFTSPIFIDRNPKHFGLLLDALTEGANWKWSSDLQAEADFWEIEIRPTSSPHLHYVTVRLGGTFVHPAILTSDGTSVRSLLPKADFLDYNQVLVRYAEKFHYRITNFWTDAISNQIIVEMTPL